MSYKVSTRATNVVVGDQVNKDRKYHSVKGIEQVCQSADATVTAVTLAFGDGSTIPLRADDYVEVRRSSKATTPVKAGRHAAQEDSTISELEELFAEDSYEDDEDAEVEDDDEYNCCNGNTFFGHSGWCPNK